MRKLFLTSTNYYIAKRDVSEIKHLVIRKLFLKDKMNSTTVAVTMRKLPMCGRVLPDEALKADCGIYTGHD
ncbi:unnamed protein product [Allacma fusca]|uniref:Uncharacterized protein n=1 Tax=Allacma fusca TaxID=39272 RepID=A0A8J2P911_9HEXA|nr:unnamed protein product [Allacma fusca]